MTLEVGKILSLSLLHNFNVLQHFFSVFFLTKRLLSHIQSVWGLVAENNREQLCSFWCLENNSNFWHLDMGVITWYFYCELETQVCSQWMSRHSSLQKISNFSWIAFACFILKQTLIMFILENDNFWMKKKSYSISNLRDD